MDNKLAFKSPAGKAEILKAYDSVMERWPSPNEKLYVDTRYGSTFVIANGAKDAPPLILLHGSAMNSIMWMSDAREYSRDHRVYAVDIPGEPGRSDERQLPFDGADFSEWLLDVCNGLGLERVSIIGISLGAWLAVKFAISHPEKADKLVLLCPAGIGNQKVSFMFKAMLHMLFGEKGTDRLYKKVNGDQPIPEEMLRYQKLIGKNFNFRREMIPLYSDEELQRLSMPVTLFVGDRDVMLHSHMTASRLRKLVPHAEINVLAEAGHALINLTERIRVFLSE